MTTKWFEAATSVPINDPNIKAEDCALECRNLYDINTGTECWGFTFYPAVPLCTLHVNNTPTASSDYLYPENRDYGELKSTFYVRRCFEGLLCSILLRKDFTNVFFFKRLKNYFE
jgi:hypothetical protein